MALNNVGASLTHRGHFQKAVETFSQAVAIFRDICESTPDSALKLQTAAVLRLVNAECELARSTSPALPYIQSVSLHRLTQEAQLTSNAVIRMEHNTSSDEVTLKSNPNVDLEAAVVLYNLGLVHRLASTMSSECTLRLAASKYFELSYSLLRKTHDDCECAKYNKVDTLPALVLVLRSLVTCASRNEEQQAYLADLKCYKADLEFFVSCCAPIAAAEAA